MPSETTLARPTDRPLEQQTIESDEPDLFDAPKPVPAPIAANLPVPVARPRRGRRLRLAIGLLVILIAGGTGGFYWWKSVQSQLPAGIFWGNGRIEADPIDIATKFAGRIAALSADQGDMVKAGQVVARMDTRDLEASLKKAQAQVELSHRAIDEANANAVQLNSQVLLAQQEFDRAVALAQKGFQTKEILDQRQQQLDGARAALRAAQAREIEAEHFFFNDTATAEIYTMLDISYVDMDI